MEVHMQLAIWDYVHVNVTVCDHVKSDKSTNGMLSRQGLGRVSVLARIGLRQDDNSLSPTMKNIPRDSLILS